MSAGGPEFGFCMSLGESVSVTSGFAKGLMEGVQERNMGLVMEDS